MSELLYRNTFNSKANPIDSHPRSIFRDSHSHNVQSSYNTQSSHNALDAKQKNEIYKEETKEIIKEIRTVLSVNSSQREIYRYDIIIHEAELPLYFSGDISDITSIFLIIKNSLEASEIRRYTVDIPISPVLSLPRSLVVPPSYATTVSGIDILPDSVIVDPDCVLINQTPEYLVNLLNITVMSMVNKKNTMWRPFYLGIDDEGNKVLKMITYKDQYPNAYSVYLPQIINNVKSVRLISTEIPNTVNNITERNNIIVVLLEEKVNDVWVSAAINSTLTPFDFIFVTLHPGIYTLSELLTEMTTEINSAIRTQTVREHGNVIDITLNANTGAVKIFTTRDDLRFHIKFYSYVVENHDEDIQSVPSYNYYNRDLWYMLGFPWPFEINTDGSDKYVTVMTNTVLNDSHYVFTPDHEQSDIFIRTDTSFSTLYADNSLKQHYTYKYPSVNTPVIYLSLKNLDTLGVYTHNNLTSEKKVNDKFAKIQLPCKPGEIAYNTYVNSPLIFPNAIDKLEKLEIQWMTDDGELVDFNQVDHSFTLEFIHYHTQLNTNNYNSQLGSIDKKSYPSYLDGGSA